MVEAPRDNRPREHHGAPEGPAAPVCPDHGAQEDLDDPKYDGPGRETRQARERLEWLTDKLVARFLFDRDIWREAQAHDLPWTPIRRPEENTVDEHWLQRGCFFDVHHPELGETFLYAGAKWFTEGAEWRRGPRPPLVGEHTDEVRQQWTGPKRTHTRIHVSERASRPPLTSPRAKPFALSDVRVVDLSWMLASAGAEGRGATRRPP